MPTSAEYWERRAQTAVEGMRDEFRRALSAREREHCRLTAFGGELYVDQRREIVADGTGHPDTWVIEDGKWTISVSNELNRGVLALVVGADRFLNAEHVFLALGDLLTERRCRLASSAAELANLLIVEGALFPTHDAPVLATVAWCLANGRGRDDIYEILPDLVTEYDRYFARLPVADRYARKLSPRRESAAWDVYGSELVQRLFPELDVRRLSVDARERLLNDYAREHFFARLASAIDSAGGAYVQLPSG